MIVLLSLSPRDGFLREEFGSLPNALSFSGKYTIVLKTPIVSLREEFAVKTCSFGAEIVPQVHVLCAAGR